MAYLKEADVRSAARAVRLARAMESAAILREASARVPDDAAFDVFLCHSIRDSDLVLGAKVLLERAGLKVYVDWIIDPQMERSEVTATTASILRNRMNHSSSLFYLFSGNSRRSRWMPWELGYFDGYSGAVAILPVEPDYGDLDFSEEEYLGLYPKVEVTTTSVLINKTKRNPVPASDTANFRAFRRWLEEPGKLRL